VRSPERRLAAESRAGQRRGGIMNPDAAM